MPKPMPPFDEEVATPLQLRDEAQIIAEAMVYFKALIERGHVTSGLDRYILHRLAGRIEVRANGFLDRAKLAISKPINTVAS